MCFELSWEQDAGLCKNWQDGTADLMHCCCCTFRLSRHPDCGRRTRRDCPLGGTTANRATHPAGDTVLFNTPVTVVTQNAVYPLCFTLALCGVAVKRLLLLDLAALSKIDCWGTHYPHLQQLFLLLLGACFWVRLTMTTRDVHRLSTLQMCTVIERL